jgi:hypothetical protein
MGGRQPKNGHHVYGRLVRDSVEELVDLQKERYSRLNIQQLFGLRVLALGDKLARCL